MDEAVVLALVEKFIDNVTAKMTDAGERNLRLKCVERACAMPGIMTGDVLKQAQHILEFAKGGDTPGKIEASNG